MNSCKLGSFSHLKEKNEKRNYFHLTHRVREDDYNYTVTAKHSETIYDFKVQSRLKRISMRPKFFWIMRHTVGTLSFVYVCIWVCVWLWTPHRNTAEKIQWKCEMKRKLSEHSLAEIDLRIRAAIKSHNKREIWCEGSLLCQFNLKKNVQFECYVFAHRRTQCDMVLRLPFFETKKRQQTLVKSKSRLLDTQFALRRIKILHKQWKRQ